MQKRFKDVLRSYLPEVLNFFSQLDSKVLLELLSKFPSKQAIIKNEEQVIQLLTSFRNWNEQKAKAFVNAIKRSIGRKDKHQVAQTIILSITQQLKQIKEQIQSIDDQIKQMMEQFDQTNFPDIPGMGDTTKATIISEVGDIEKFESKEKFVSYIKHKTQGNIEKREQSAEKDILQLSDKSDKVDREVQEEIPRANIKWQKAKASDNSHSEEIS
ncbi:transposase [Fervidobacterium thailandense]|uniref:transposase n=1 Tax=Fervidobacterium thailandense TaxID=1008305 RepID=UPI00355B924C